MSGQSQPPDLFGFSGTALALAGTRRYDEAEIVFRTLIGDDVEVAQRVMNMRWLRKCLEKQNKINEARSVAANEVNIASATNDSLLITNVVGSVAMFLLRHGTLEHMSSLLKVARKYAHVADDEFRPVNIFLVSSSLIFLYSVVARMYIRLDVRGINREREFLQNLIFENVPFFLEPRPSDILHRMQPDSNSSAEMMPFSFLLAHAEFADFERRIGKMNYFGRTTEQWLDAAAERITVSTDTSIFGSDSDFRRLSWLMFATISSGTEGVAKDLSFADCVAPYRQAMLTRTKMQVSIDTTEQANLYLQARAFEDLHALDWPFYEDQGMFSEYF